MSDLDVKRTSGDPCPKCDGTIFLADPAEYEGLFSTFEPDPGELDDDVWLCTYCGWWEEATPEESLEEAVKNLEWLMSRLGSS